MPSGSALLASLWGNAAHADCLIRFCREQQQLTTETTSKSAKCGSSAARPGQNAGTDAEPSEASGAAQAEATQPEKDDKDDQQHSQQQQDEGQEEPAAAAHTPPGTESGDAHLGTPSLRHPVHYLGEPVHVHTAVVAEGSDYLKGRLGTWGGAAAAAGAAGRCEVLVPLGSEAEVPHATEALRFIYTGELTSNLRVHALLRVRQQAGYLGVGDCVAACDTALLALLGSSSARALEAYACHELFPQPGTSPHPDSFAHIEEVLRQQLVAHFSDAVRALSNAKLQAQLLRLPACAVEALLESNFFTTDGEASVVLLVVAWADANPHAAPELVWELWRQVRLSHVGRTYMSFVLPRLADSIPLTIEQLGFLQFYASASKGERDVSSEDFELDLSSGASPAWLLPPPRPLGPHTGDRRLQWSISAEELGVSLRWARDTGAVVTLPVRIDGGDAAALGCARASADSGTRALLHGLLWGLALNLDPELLWPQTAAAEASAPPAAMGGAWQGQSGPVPAAATRAPAWSGAPAAAAAAPRAAAGLYLQCDMPEPLERHVRSGVGLPSAKVVVYGWQGGERHWNADVVYIYQHRWSAVGFGSNWGVRDLVPLLPPERPRAAAAAAPGAPGAGGMEELLAPWAAYLSPEGCIEGFLNFRHPC